MTAIMPIALPRSCTRLLHSPSFFSGHDCCGIVLINQAAKAASPGKDQGKLRGGHSMDERTALSRRKLLHTLAASGVIAAADLAWWEEPLILPKRAWGAEPVRFQWSVPEPTRIALMNSMAERFNQSQKDF